MNWYLLQTKPNAHSLAQKHLKQQGFEVFAPLIIKTTRSGVKFVNKLELLFPGYLFIGTELCDLPWKSINGTRGISKAVTLDGQYRPVDVQVIEDIKCRCAKNGVLQAMDEIAVGDRVKIEKGPFAEFICAIEKISDEERAWVLMDILQQKVRTKVSIRDFLRTN